MNNNKTISPQRHEDTTNDLQRVAVASINDQRSMTNDQKQGIPKKLFPGTPGLIIERQRRATYRRRPACPECRQDARPTNCARAALPYFPNSYLLTPQCSANSYLLTPNSSRHQPRPPVTCNLSPVTSSRRRAGFTLVEMLVALSILIILMAAVGEIFSLAGRTVRVGQATLAAMSSIRAVESQIARDIHHLDTNGFLIIRQRYYAPQWMPGVQYEPGDEVYDLATARYFYCQQANTTAPGATTTSEPPTKAPYSNSTWLNLTGFPGQPPIWRADQLSFMETGNFYGRTGSIQAGRTSMIDNLTSNKAIVWFGQLTASYGPAALNYKTGPATFAPNPTNRTELDDAEQPYWRQNSWVPMGMPPSGETSGQFYFGRQAILLEPNGLSQVLNGTPPNAANSYIYNNPFFNSQNSTNSGTLVYTFAPAGESLRPVITSSRLDAAYDAVPAAAVHAIGVSPGSTINYVSPSGVGTIEAYLSSLPLSATAIGSIADFFCYRYSTLITPAASEQPKAPPLSAAQTIVQMLNGYARMTPIMLQGVPSFSVDWTDGLTSTYATGAENTKALNWYGLNGNTGSPTSNGYPTPANTNGPWLPSTLNNGTTPILVQGNSNPASLNPVYVFYAGNKAEWPKALKITYAVTDPNNRLQGGRFVTQVVELPQ